jgi:hypothetical protein
MTANTGNPATTPELAATDSGLRCPRCDYNLTGLTRARCPECGETFDWDAVRRASQNVPTIAFERARGWRRIPAFFVTWATVLFTPWIFARQAVMRLGTADGIAFGLICFVTTAGGFATDMDLDFWATWLCTAIVYVALQTVGLALADWPGWRHPAQTLRFWLLVGCYTSAVMTTEIVRGPPPVFVEDLWAVLRGTEPNSWMDEVFELSVDAAVWWTQIALWLAALGACYAARLRRAHYPATLVWPAVVVVVAGVLFLYATAVQHIGSYFSELFD